MMNPQITHIPCDLDQQRKRIEAKRWSVARAVERSRGRRSLWDRIRRRSPVSRDVVAADLRTCEGEDVFHGLKF
jgi:hypothetical protein